MNSRFSKPVIPGDTLTVSMWVDGSEALFRTTNQDDDVVIDQGVFRFD
jgi:acyl dehydratase